METLLEVTDAGEPSTLKEVLGALKKQNLSARLETKTWGDWIYLDGYQTVISIESHNGLSSSATVEHGDDEGSGEPIDRIFQAFAKLGWHGVDDDGEFPL